MKIQFISLPLIRRKFMREGMHKLHDVLKNSPLHNRFWICGGALLGYAREGKILKHDTDIDFHFWREDRDKFEESAKLLISAGFKPEFRWRNRAGESTEHILSWKKIKFEFFEVHRVNNKMRWYEYGGGVLHGSGLTEMLCETPSCDLEEFEFCGRTWLKPIDHDADLSAVYGDWKTPNPDYSYYKDSKAVISRTPLPGKIPW